MRLLLTFTFLVSLPGICFTQAEVKKEVKKGNLLYNREEFKGALKHYEQRRYKVMSDW